MLFTSSIRAAITFVFAVLGVLLHLPSQAATVADFTGASHLDGAAYDHLSSGFTVQLEPNGWRFLDADGDGDARGEIRSWVVGGQYGGGFDTRSFINNGQLAEFQLDLILHPDNRRDRVTVTFENGWLAPWPGSVFSLSFPIDPSWPRDGVTVRTITLAHPAAQPQGWFNRVSLANYTAATAAGYSLRELRMNGIAPAPAAAIPLGSWHALNPGAETTWTLVHHRGRLYLGHELNGLPNRAVHLDLATGLYDVDRHPDGSVVVFDNEQIHTGQIRQGDLVWAGEDGAVLHNGAWLHLRRHDGWRTLAVPGSNAHRQSQYVRDGKIFFSTYGRGSPGVGISHDAGLTIENRDLRSAAPNADFPLVSANGASIRGWWADDFFEFQGNLFATNFNTIGQGSGSPLAECYLMRYTGDPAVPWERTYRKQSELGVPGKDPGAEALYLFRRGMLEFNGHLFVFLLDYVNGDYIERLLRYGAEDFTGSSGVTYKRPANGVSVSDHSVQSLLVRHGFIYRIDRTGHLMTILRSADGENWIAIHTLDVGPDSPLAALGSPRQVPMEIVGTDIYLAAGTQVFKIPGSLLGVHTPSGANNTAPVALDDFYVAVPDGSCVVDEALVGPLRNDHDAHNDPFYAELVSGPAHGAVTFRYNGTFRYQADPGHTGTDSFTYKINDGQADSQLATVTISIPTNRPVARFVVRPVSATATVISTGAANSNDAATGIANVINNSGLGTPLDTGDAVPITPATVLAAGNPASPTLWLGGDHPLDDQRITLDLGADYLLTGLLLWNGTESGFVARRSVRRAHISTSLDGVNYTHVGAFDFHLGNPGGMAMQTATFPSPRSARHVRFEPALNYAAYNVNIAGIDPTGDRRYSFDEIRLVARPPLSLPEAPSDLTAVADGSRRINLAWTDNANSETGYIIERSPDGAAYALLAHVAADVTAYADTGLAAYSTYHYRVIALGPDGDSAYATSAATTTDADYAAWSQFLPVGSRAPTDTPYGDGVPNLLRYALALDPTRAITAAERALLPALNSPTQFAFSLPALPPADVRYGIETSTNLTTPWTEIAAKSGRSPWTGSPAPTEAAPSAGRIQTTLAIPPPAPARFVRLRVTQQAAP